MSAAVLRAAHGQRFGFISSKTLGWNLAADEADLAGSLGEAAAENNLAEYFETLKPRHPQFKALKDGLVRYRQIAASGGWEPVPGDKPIELSGDTRLPALKARLAAEGYMSAAADDSALLEAVKAFQKRNGLGTDGRIGKGTLAALNVPVEDRIDQIAANLERWRHMRHAEPEAYVVANVADQSVAVIRDGREDLRLRTIVGTRRHATPMLEATVTAVTMNPPWVIPISIITNEILPKLNKDPNYLIENDMEVVSGNWENPRSLRVRQRPGAGNALGHMKFQMQNRWNIYLHDTPSRAFFAKDDRYLSHGCIRVDQPHELAINLLKDASAEDLNAAIASGETRTVKLEKPLPVFVLYWSVFADKNGDINFRRDFYERDSQTANALAGAGLLERPAEVVQNGN
jgi:murein L,D-transpeptidase YcbB/YkuD